MDSKIADVAWSKISFFLRYGQKKENGEGDRACEMIQEKHSGV
jgi:hypothetical protein